MSLMTNEDGKILTNKGKAINKKEATMLEVSSATVVKVNIEVGNKTIEELYNTYGPCFAAKISHHLVPSQHILCLIGRNLGYNVSIYYGNTSIYCEGVNGEKTIFSLISESANSKNQNSYTDLNIDSRIIDLGSNYNDPNKTHKENIVDFAKDVLENSLSETGRLYIGVITGDSPVMAQYEYQTDQVVIYESANAGDETFFNKFVYNSQDDELLDFSIPHMIVRENSENIYIAPNIYHIVDSQVAPNITLMLLDYNPKETYVYREYMGEIRVDENPITATVPEGIRWNETDGAVIEGTTLTLEAKKTYLFSILNYIGLISSVANPQLDAPILTLEGSVLSWEAINNAKTYRVYTIDNDLFTLSNTEIDLQNYITSPGVYTVYVEAKDNYYTDNVASIEYVISVTLSTPTNLVVNESNTLSWDSVENASSYLVTLKETSSTKTVTTNLCDLTTFTELATAGTYTFEVNAVGDNKVYLTSNASVPITVTIPEA